MALASIGSAWKTDLQTGLRNANHERIKIDFRNLDYPDVARDTRTFIDRGNCESATEPTVRGETSDTNSNTTFARSTAQFRRGASSFLLTKTIAAGTEGYTALQDSTAINDMHGFLAGETVDIMAWCYIPSTGGPQAAEVTVRVQEYYSAAWNATTIATATTQDAWEKLAGTITLTDDTVSVRLEVVIASAAADTEYCYWDDIDVYRRATFTLAREDNLMDRANCESATIPAIDGLTAAAATNGTFARDSTVSRSGSYSFKHLITATGTVSNAWLTPNSTTNMCGFAAGEVVEYECYVYAPDGAISVSEISIQMEEYDNSGAAWTSLGTTAASGSTLTWLKISGTWTIPSDDVTGIRIRLRILAAAANSEFYYVDDFIVRRHSVPGTHKLTSGYTKHLAKLTDSGTMRIKFKPNFAYNVATDQTVFAWYVSGTQEMRFWYQAANDTFQLNFIDGGTTRNLRSAVYDTGLAERNINQWIDAVLTWDITNGTGGLYMNGTSDDTSWSAAPDSLTTEQNVLEFRSRAGGVGNLDIAYAEYIPDYECIAADVANDFQNVEEERIWWSFDGHATGMTRCDVTRHVNRIDTEAGVGNRLSGSHGANSAGIGLINTNGEFSDDQYAAFTPASDQFNGTVAQKYLQNKSRVWLESWYSGDFDNILVGRVTDAGYQRTTQRDNASMVSIEVEDGIAELALTPIENAEVHENTELSGTTEANSLIHISSRKGRARTRQYLANNSFEDPGAITDSWQQGVNTTLSQQTGGLFGTNMARLVIAGGEGFTTQDVLFTGTEKLSVDQTFTLSVFVQSSAAASGASNRIRISERDSVGSNSSTDESYVLAGGEGWKSVDVQHTIADADSDRLRCVVYAADGDTIEIDGAMLIQGGRELYVFQESSLRHNNAAASGAIDADYAELVTWDWFGFDVDSISDTDGAIVHPWYRIESRSTPWTNDKAIANATGPRYVGLDSNGTFRLRSILSAAGIDNTENEPISMEVLDENTVKQGIGATLSMRRANKIVGHGANYEKYVITRVLWDAKASDAFARNTAGQLAELVLNGAKWPSSTKYGVFFASFGEEGAQWQDEIETKGVDTPSAMEMLSGGVTAAIDVSVNIGLIPFFAFLDLIGKR